MTKKRGGKTRKPRVLRARPLLVAVGATITLAAGCNPPLGVGVNPYDAGVPVNTADMGKPALPPDLSKPPID